MNVVSSILGLKHDTIEWERIHNTNSNIIKHSYNIKHNIVKYGIIASLWEPPGDKMWEKESHWLHAGGVGDDDEVQGLTLVAVHHAVQGPAHFEPQIVSQGFSFSQIDENESDVDIAGGVFHSGGRCKFTAA